MNKPEAAADFSFSGLTPDLIANALASVGVDPQSGLLALNSYENRVYQFVADDNRRYVTKFYRPARWSNAQILEEHAFTRELAEQEVPAVAPLELNGKTLHSFDDYRFAVFPSIGGRAVEPGDLDQLERIGRQIGRLHAVAQQGVFVHRLGSAMKNLLPMPWRRSDNRRCYRIIYKVPFGQLLNLLLSYCVT